MKCDKCSDELCEVMKMGAKRECCVCQDIDLCTECYISVTELEE